MVVPTVSMVAAPADSNSASELSSMGGLVPQGGSQKSKGASALGGSADLFAQRLRQEKQLAFKSQKYYGMGFLGILNGCSIYAVAY